MACVCSRYNARSDWPTAGHYSPVMSTGRLLAPNPSKKPYNKQLINPKRSDFTGKTQTSALSIARSIGQGVGLRFSRKDLTLG